MYFINSWNATQLTGCAS